MDPISTEHLTSLANQIWIVAVTFVPRLLVAILIFGAAIFVARRVSQGLFKLTGRVGHIDPTIRFVLGECIRYGIIVLALVAALDQLGVRTTSLFAVLGAAGLAIGLALQGTLSNIAAGVMLLWLRPFQIGDYVEVNNVPGLSGTVRQIGLFTCQLEAFDGLYLFVPNAGLWNVPLRNYTRNPGRLISLAITLPQKRNIEMARKTLIDLALADTRIAKTPQPLVFVDRIAAESSLLIFRVWAVREYIGVLQRDLIEVVSRALEDGEAESAGVQVVRTVPPDTDPTRLLAI